MKKSGRKKKPNKSERASDKKIPPGTGYCKCAVCEEVFNSDFSFRAHRAGEIGSRRCMTPAEMKKNGLMKSARGYWITDSKTAAAARLRTRGKAP